MNEVFLVSIIYWTILLIVFVWLNRRLTALRANITNLEVMESEEEKKG